MCSITPLNIKLQRNAILIWYIFVSAKANSFEIVSA